MEKIVVSGVVAGTTYRGLSIEGEDPELGGEFKVRFGVKTENPSFEEIKLGTHIRVTIEQVDEQ